MIERSMLLIPVLVAFWVPNGHAFLHNSKAQRQASLSSRRDSSLLTSFAWSGSSSYLDDLKPQESSEEPFSSPLPISPQEVTPNGDATNTDDQDHVYRAFYEADIAWATDFSTEETKIDTTEITGTLLDAAQASVDFVAETMPPLTNDSIANTEPRIGSPESSTFPPNPSFDSATKVNGLPVTSFETESPKALFIREGVSAFPTNPTSPPVKKVSSDIKKDEDLCFMDAPDKDKFFFLSPEDMNDATTYEEPVLTHEDRYLNMLSTETNVKRLIGENPYAISDIPLDVVFKKWLDSLEDGVVEIINQNALPSTRSDRPTVVVLGTGWASHSFVQMASALDYRIIVVSPVNHFVFTPMLASAAVGTVEYRSMTEAIRVTNRNIDNYIDGRATGINVEAKELRVQLNTANRNNPFESTDIDGEVIQLPYDYLVCAVGTRARSSIAGQDYCYNLKTTQDSKRLRFAIGEALEYASRPDVQGNDPASRMERQRRVRFVIIGGGATGVELAAELNDFVEESCRSPDGAYYRLANDVSIALVHGGSEILPQFDPALRQRALRALQDRGVQVRLNTRTVEVGKSFVTIRNKEDGFEETIPIGIAVWGAGNEPVPFVKELLSQLPPAAASPTGRICVDGYLRCPTPTPETFGSIFVLGDASSISDPSSASEILPQTAQVAGQQGAFLARLFNRGYKLDQVIPSLSDPVNFWESASPLRIWLFLRSLQESPPFAFLNLGLLAYVGGGQAITQVQLGEVPIWSLAGKRAFVLWRSVYLAKQAGSRNQAQLVFDWVKSQMFGRDITRL